MPFNPFWRLVTRWIFFAGTASGLAQGSNVATGLLHGGFSVRIWQTEDGLPQNTVGAITQTRDGYLWIGTYGGLARFDGVRFQNFDAINTPELVDARIISLHEDRKGVLWIGHDSGRVTKYRLGQFENFAGQSTLTTERVAAIDEDVSGAVWLLRQSGRLEAIDGRVVPRLKNGPAPQVMGLTHSDDGSLYVANDGEVARLSQGKLEPIEFGQSLHSGFVMGLGAAQKGGLWVLRDWAVKKWRDAGWSEDRGPAPWGGETSLSAVLEMRNGCLAVGTMEQGLYLFFPDGRSLRFDRSSGLPQNWVRSLFEDREGNLWIGAGSGGLVQIAPSPFSIISPSDQWQGRTALSVTGARDGSLWIGTEGAGLYRHQADRWTHYGEAEGLGHSFVWSVAEDASGQIWAGTWGAGLYRLEQERFIRVPGYDPAAGPVFGLQFAPDENTLWIAAGHGLVRWERGNASWEFRDGVSEGAMIWTVARDRAANIWFGISDGGLGRLSHGELTRFHQQDGLGSEAVQCLLAADDGALWIGTAGGGLSRFKNGRISSIGVKEGLGSNIICHISDDGRGFLWLSSRHGLLKVAKQELDKCADRISQKVSCQVYDRSDGLPTIEFSGGLQSSGCTTADGRLWFTSSKGVIAVDPAQIHSNEVPPAMALESLMVDTRSVPLGNGSIRIELPPDHERLEFHYTALSLTAPSKVIFKYRLEGLDKDWVDAGTKRAVSYSHLPAGAYQFGVIACNNDGVWNTRGVTLSLTVLPFFWQTWWFLALAGFVVITAVAGIVRHETRRRMQRRIEHWERQHAIEKERARIAQDIHDDIGASLTRITMLSQSDPADAARSPQTIEALERIYDTAGEVTRALDEIVWAVDPRHDSLDSLVCYMGKFAQDFLGAAHVRCRLDLPVSLPAWPLTTEVRHHLFLAFKEALNNALKHSGAREVRVSLLIRADAFELSVIDDGRGFDRQDGPDPAKRAVLGNGLKNLRTRLVEIGGRCEVASEAGMGTRVTFIVAIPAHHRGSVLNKDRARSIAPSSPPT
jgi:signal transduction histidine kinase/ligand-binding sensor domain-containing protein